jgi:hypothetical protein
VPVLAVEGYETEKCYVLGANLTYSSRRYGVAIRGVIAG